LASDLRIFSAYDSRRARRALLKHASDMDSCRA